MTDSDEAHSADFSLGSIDYPAGFYHQLAPVHLNYICALNGVRGPNLSAPFNYCELRCGAGETTNVLAAANPAAAAMTSVIKSGMPATWLMTRAQAYPPMPNMAA